MLFSSGLMAHWKAKILITAEIIYQLSGHSSLQEQHKDRAPYLIFSPQVSVQRARPRPPEYKNISFDAGNEIQASYYLPSEQRVHHHIFAHLISDLEQPVLVNSSLQEKKNQTFEFFFQ